MSGGGPRRDIEETIGLLAVDPTPSWLTRDQVIRIAALEAARHIYPVVGHGAVSESERAWLLERLLATGDTVAGWIATGPPSERPDDPEDERA